MESAYEAKPHVEELLGELEKVRRRLEEAVARQMSELNWLRSQRSFAVELEHTKMSPSSFSLQSPPLVSAITADVETDLDAKALNHMEAMALPGVPVTHEAWPGQNENRLGSVERCSSRSLALPLDEDTFAVRCTYIKSEAELARLHKIEKVTATDTDHCHTPIRKSMAKQFSVKEEAKIDIGKFIRNPTSSITKRNWDMLGCFLLAYDVLFIPLSEFGIGPHPMLSLLEVVGVMYWSLDICMTMTTGYYKDAADLDPVMDFGNILRHYFLSKNFPFDLALITVDWVILISRAAGRPADDLSAVGLARMVRVTRVLRLMKLLRVSKASGLIENLRRWFSYSVDQEVLILFGEIMKIGGLAFLVFHYMVCLYYSVGKMEGSWIPRDRASLPDEPFFTKYFVTGSLLSMRANSYTKGVERDILTFPEKIFDMSTYAVFLGLQTWLTSTVTSRMLEVQRSKRARNEKIDYIRHHYLVLHQVDPRVRLQVLKFMDKGYADYRTAQQRQKNETELLEAFPVQLARDFRREAWNPVLCQHMFFQTFDRWEMEDICLIAASEVFCRKHEIVFKQNGACSRMLFVFEGQFLYGIGINSDEARLTLSQSPLVFGELQQDCDIDESGTKPIEKGSWLSEPVLWTTSWQHRGSLLTTASGYFCAISPQELETVLQRHEAALHDVVRYATKFVQQLNEKAAVNPDLLSDIADEVMNDAFQAVERYMFD